MVIKMNNESIFEYDALKLIGYLTELSHKMRTPLNAILGLTGLCLENENIDEELYTNLKKIYSAGIILLGNVDEMIHVTGGQDASKFEAISPDDAVFDRSKIPDRISLPYASVLVVDDNPVNLDVAKGLLELYRIKVDCVTSGQLVIDAIITGEPKYDVILMDHMMPDMDGIEATHRIRDIETDYAKNIPVIMMTANAIAGSKEMFLDKGFQAYLAKPVDALQLDEIIKTWIHDEEKEKKYVEKMKNNLDKAETGDINTISVINNKEVPGLDMAKAISRFGGNEDAFLSVLRSYTVNTRSVLAALSKLTKDDIQNYEIAVHGLKGSSASICAYELAKMAGKLEDAAQEGDWDFISLNSDPFIEATYKMASDIEALFDKIESENPKPKKDRPDAALLLQLSAACDAYDMDGVDDALDELTKYSYESDGDLVIWLQENVDMMNFSDITERLSNFDLHE